LAANTLSSVGQVASHRQTDPASITVPDLTGRAGLTVTCRPHERRSIVLTVDIAAEQ
jgi:hypothetical protein